MHRPSALWSSETFTASDGASLAFFTAGSANLRVFLLHCFGGHSQLWTEVVEVLVPAGYGCVALDFRGTGRSQRTPCDLTSHRLALDVLELADHLALDRFLAVGHSMGGKIALHVHGMAPQRLGALALLGTPGPGLVDVPRSVLEECIQSPDRIAWTQAFFRPWFVVWPAPLIDAWQNSFASMPDWALWATAEASLWTDISPCLPKNFPPALVVIGNDDPVYGPAYQQQAVLTYLPDATVCTLETCGHGLVLEHPQRVAAELCAFFERAQTSGT